ncbi:MAG: DUF1993 domain-containing protein [Usitatibacter sp.]
MTISMYQAAVPTAIRALNNLADLLTKAQAHAEAKKIDESAFVSSRLFPNMFALGKQVQVAADSAKLGIARIAGVTPPSYEDNEATFAELIERCRKTVAYLETIKPEQLDGSEDRVVTWSSRTAKRSMKAQAYLLSHVLPNIFFHVTTAYALLRHNGVEVGKTDFLGKLDLIEAA